MAISMTGFGRGEYKNDNYHYLYRSLTPSIHQDYIYSGHGYAQNPTTQPMEGNK